MDWQELANRCENADGPSRSLDAAIAKAIGAEHGVKEEVFYETRSIHYIDECAAFYTASIDAALTLVPAQCQFQLDTLAAKGAWVRIHSLEASEIWDSEAKTLPLAICAAALRASQQQGGE